MSPTDRPSRAALLRRQGLTESAFAVLTAVMLLGSTASPAIVAGVGLLAIGMAWRARRTVELAVPLDDGERRELQRLAGGSRHVRDLLAVLEKAGQAPVRLDLVRCLRLAQGESMLDGRA